ncbi:MAG TPA: fasciclin domain-containing protein [Candidatus Elarobacter sp.]
MRLTRAAACRSLAGCLLALSFTGPALAQPRPATVLELAAQQKNLTTFVAAVHAAGLDDTLKAAGPITVYAPTDEAFAKLPAADRDALMHDPARLKALLLRHVVNDMIKMRDGDAAITSGSVASAGGGMLSFGTDNDRTTVGGAHVISYDLRADNGCITTIDKVLLT